MQSLSFVHSQISYSKLLQSVVQPGTRWLDVGCGQSILPEWIRGSLTIQKTLIEKCEIAHGCDPVDDRPHRAGLLKYVGDCSILPYPDDYFDLVTANMVAEHVADPAVFASEVARVLAPGGRFVLHTPNLLYPPILTVSLLPKKLVKTLARLLDGREDADIFPTFYRMNTRRALSRLPFFRVEELRCVETAPILEKVPLANFAESLLIRLARIPRFQDFRADWLAVLRKAAETDIPAEEIIYSDELEFAGQ
jgi:SAM-dependent methyltransferase